MSISRQRGSRRKPVQHARDANKIDAILEGVRESLLCQQTSAEPSVRDVILPRVKKNKVYTFMQSTQTQVSSTTGTETDGSLSFSLSSLGNASSFAAIFDTYRIVGVRVQFIPETGIISLPSVYTVIDYDDSSATALSALVEYDTLKVAPPGAFFERSLVPRIAVAAYSGAFTSFAQMSNQWIDCGSTGVVFYGLKYALTATTAVATYQILTTYTIQFRNPR
jgi:hypothetical protein